MKKTKQLIALALLAAIGLSSCGGGTGSDETTASSDTTTAASVETEKGLAFEKEDNGGKTFTILTTTHAEYEYIAEEQTGEVVNDAVYERNRSVEDLLGISLEFVVENGHWADRNSFNALIKNSVMAGDGAYDLVNGVTVCVLPAAADGIFTNALELENVDFTNPWWVQGMDENLAIGGKLFGFIGDASLSLYKDLSVMYFNKGLLESYQLENPYELVRSNEWTIDKLFEMASIAASDLDGDSTMNKDTDQFGYIAHYVPQRAFQTATEMKVFDFDEDGNPFVTSLSERDIDIYNRLNTQLMNREIIYAVDVSDHTELTKIFEAGRSLFMLDFLYATEYLREMDDDFGIVPMPKADSEQESYHSQIGTSTSMFFVPKTTADVALTGKVCEALSYYSYKNVVPTYYEVALKEKYTRDDDVKEMLEIIRQTAQMDFTFAYSTMFEPFPNSLTECRENNTIQGNLSSFFASKQTVWQGKVDEILEAYAAMG